MTSDRTTPTTRVVPFGGAKAPMSLLVVDIVGGTGMPASALATVTGGHDTTFADRRRSSAGSNRIAAGRPLNPQDRSSG